jgi:hypothetical protein
MDPIEVLWDLLSEARNYWTALEQALDDAGAS